jgi:MFS family permease
MTLTQPKGRLAGVLAATLSTQALASWAMLVLAAIAPMVADSFDLPAVLIGYQIAIVYFVGTATSLVAGGLVRRWGACRVSQVCVLACALGCLIVLLPALPAIALGSAFIGFGYGLTNPSSAHLLAKRTTARNRSFVFSIKQTGVPIGGVTAGLLTPLIAVTWGWQAAVAVIIPVALLLAGALVRPREDWDADRNPSASTGIGELRNVSLVFAYPGMRWLCFCGFCFAAIQLCVMTFIVSFGVTELAYSAIVGGALLATVQGSGVAGRLTWGFVADRMQRNDLVLMMLGLVTAACCIVCSMVDAGSARWAFFVLAAVFGACAVGWNGVFLAEVVRLSPPRMVGTAVSAASVATFSGVLVGPTMFVQLFGWIGSYASAFGLLAIVALFGSLGVALAGRRAPGATPQM